MEKKTIGVFFGSRSAEHDVSIITALLAVIAPLKRTNHYNIVPVYIAKNGAWFSDQRLFDVRLYTSGTIEEFIKSAKPAGVIFNGGLTIIKPGLKNQLIPIDIAFPATHGTYGEDGSLMGLLRMANVPFVGCDLAASAIAMDKVLAKQIAEREQIPVAKWVWCTKHSFETAQEAVLEQISQLEYPLFVKPAHLGSSIGITRVLNSDELVNALEVAAHYDDKIIIEEAIPNLIEVTVPIMGNDQPRLGLVERPLSLTDEGVFDFETKYMHRGKGSKGGGKKGSQGYSQLPAELPEELYKRAEETALAVYRALGCAGISRVDLLIDDKKKQVYFNEVNPLPGDLYLHNWRAAGISPVDVVSELIGYALERYEMQQRIVTAFQTNYLRQF